MCGMLDSYLQEFSKLRTDTNRNSWTKSTNYKSPYKPFLLLSILDLIGYGSITKNFIEPSFELTETFQGYIGLLPPMNRQASMAYPFFYMQSADLWNLQPRLDAKIRSVQAIGTMKKLRELYYGAKFSDDLFPLLQMQLSREKLRAVLIKTYFSPEIQPRLWEQSALNYEAANYSTSLLVTADSPPPSDYAEKSIVPPEKVRDQGFRKAIVQLYAHRCALCGIKILTLENHTIVDAAHIIPWAKSHDDHPTNGMALCKLCHWTFDEGLMAVNSEYQVMVSPMVKKDQNLPGHILTLSDRPIFRPQESQYWPTQDNFQWHRQERFKKSG